MARTPPAPGLRATGRLVARGTAENPASRFERLVYDGDADGAWRDDWGDGGDPEVDGSADRPALRTRYYRDPSRSVLAHNDSPDLRFRTSLNPYRGCEHACVYCYARPTHEYLGLSAGLDFETHILVKEDAPELLHKALAARRWEPQVVAVGANTDPYQPIERRLALTRRCLEVFAEFRNPAAIITKSALVTRDLDVLVDLARDGAVGVRVSITSLDDRIRRAMEPRASSPRRRLEAVRALADAGVPVGVMLAPIVPGLTDHEIPAIVEAAADAGATRIDPIVLRLPHGVKDLFAAWLERHFPERKQKVLNRVRSLRGGRLNDPRFHARMRGEGLFAQQIQDWVALAKRRAGFRDHETALSTAAFRRPPDPQLSLF